MEIKLEGVVRELLPLQQGEGRNGPWKKQQFILEIVDGQYPKHVCIMVWGDKIDQFNIREGDDITAFVNIESREYNGRWYTDVKAWRVEKQSASAIAPPPAEHYPPEGFFPPEQPQQPIDQNGDAFAEPFESDDLPF